MRYLFVAVAKVSSYVEMMIPFVLRKRETLSRSMNGIISSVRTDFRYGYLLIITLTWVLVACDNEATYAPVTEIKTTDPMPVSGRYRVKSGETLYEIAWRYGLDYRYLAARNQIAAPYAIQAGQLIYLHDRAPSVKKYELPPAIVRLARTVKAQPEPIVQLPVVQPAIKEPQYAVARWIWPAKERVIRSFSYKGINILGQLGDPIFAAAPGKVVYAGSGLRGYGNLIILKHNSLYLSAYAHNQTLLVKEGDWVKQGQKIAEMGKTGVDKVMLHFEIRRAGISVDPRQLLN